MPSLPASHKNIQKGLAALEAKLWNGQYYDLVVDRNGTRNPLCMSGQVGEGYTKMVELAPVIPQERMRSALRAIARTTPRQRNTAWSSSPTARAGCSFPPTTACRFSPAASSRR